MALSEEETMRFMVEIRKEVRLVIEGMKVRIYSSEPREMFSVAMVTAGLTLAALDYSGTKGVPPAAFVEALRSLAGKLEADLVTKSGVFVPQPEGSGV